MELSHRDFLKLWDEEKVAIGVDRLRLRNFYTSPFIIARLKCHKTSRFHNSLANWLNGLSVPILCSSVLGAFLIAWWAFPALLVIGTLANRAGYKYRRQAIMELALSDAPAYKYMVEDGIIHLRAE